MAIHDYADERAYKFYSHGFVGNKHGDNGTNYKTSWNSTSEGLKPTKVYKPTSCREYCVYCGNTALPIQNLDYDVIGYTCCCKGAMDEVEYDQALKELKKKQQQELYQFQQNAPKAPEEVKMKVLQVIFNNLSKFQIDKLLG